MLSRKRKLGERPKWRPRGLPRPNDIRGDFATTAFVRRATEKTCCRYFFLNDECANQNKQTEYEIRLTYSAPFSALHRPGKRTRKP